MRGTTENYLVPTLWTSKVSGAEHTSAIQVTTEATDSDRQNIETSVCRLVRVLSHSCSEGRRKNHEQSEEVAQMTTDGRKSQ